MYQWQRIGNCAGFFLILAVLGQAQCPAVENIPATGTSDRWVEDRPTWSATAAQVHAYDPFPEGEHPPSWPMTPAVETDALPPHEKIGLFREGPDHFGLPGQTALQVMFDFHDSATSPGTVRLVEGKKIIAGPWGIPDESHRACPQVFIGDVNHDHRIDAYIVIANDGCGLAAWMTRQVLILSNSSGGWRAWRKDGYAAVASDLIVVDRQVMVLSSDFASDQANDGKNHSYWAFDLDAIGDGIVTPADQALDPPFPRWVWYTNRDNHAITNAVGRDIQLARRHQSRWQEMQQSKDP